MRKIISANAIGLLALLTAAPALAQGMAAADAMSAAGGKTVTITIDNLLSGQPFSPSFFVARTKDSAPLYVPGDKAGDALVAVAEGGNIGMFSVWAAMNKDMQLGDAALAIHTLPGQSRTVTIHVDAEHPLIDAAWMLGNTNDGFSGFTGFDAYALTDSQSIEVKGYDAGSEKNNEKKGFLGALGGGNDRDPEDGMITEHAGVRGDADAPKEWTWDVSKPVARVTFSVEADHGAM